MSLKGHLLNNIKQLSWAKWRMLTADPHSLASCGRC